MEISCGVHHKPVKYVCTFAECKVGHFICQDCAVQQKLHTISHQNFIFALEDFLKNNTARSVKDLVSLLLQSLNDLEKAVLANKGKVMDQIKMLEEDLGSIEAAFREQFDSLRKALLEQCQGSQAKLQHQLKTIRHEVCQFQKRREDESSIFSFFSADRQCETQSQVLQSIKKHYPLFKSRSEIKALSVEVESLKGQPAGGYVRNERTKQQFQQARAKIAKEIKAALAHLKVLDQSQPFLSLRSSEHGRRLSKSETNSTIDRSQVQMPELPIERSFAPLRLEGDGSLPAQGPVQLRDGSVYKGNMRDGLRWGIGRCAFADGSVYEGYWKEDRPNGYGRIYRTDGGVYEGEVRNGRAEGTGSFVLGGLLYEGKWHLDCKEGQGEQRSSEKGYIYKGNFQKNLFSGIGILSTEKFTYEGTFQAGRFSGNGIIAFKNGDKYNGGFLEGRKHGSGLFLFADGSKYEGGFANDLPHGTGQFHHPDRSWFRGSFRNGEQDGEGVQFDGHAAKKGIWKNGFLVQNLI